MQANIDVATPMDILTSEILKIWSKYKLINSIPTGKYIPLNPCIPASGD